jgi:peroxiredoxin
MIMTEMTLLAALALVAAGVMALPAGATDRSDGVAAVFERIRSHDFHPLDDRDFTIDRELKKHGVADLDDPDWRVRLLAVRDLVRAGSEATDEIAVGLDDEHVQVRYLSAMALGVLGRSEARPALERALQQDDEAVVRSQAAIALGQINDKASLPVLRDRLEHDPSKDVRHQCELSIDQIEKGQAATDALRAAYRDLDPGTFETARVGQPAPSFTLTDTGGQAHRPIGEQGEDWIVLIWIFADWCPVCHGEFRELIEMRRDFELAGVHVYTIETHDLYRARVMVGKEVDPEYWFARESFQEAYTQKIWWPHLVDHAGAVGASYGIDPMAFAVHAEYINRPATIIIDPAGRVRWAYYGTYWGDRPSIKKTLEMIQSEVFTFVHPNRLGEP